MEKNRPHHPLAAYKLVVASGISGFSRRSVVMAASYAGLFRFETLMTSIQRIIAILRQSGLPVWSTVLIFTVDAMGSISDLRYFGWWVRLMKAISVALCFSLFVVVTGCGNPSEQDEFNRMLSKCGLPEVTHVEEVRRLHRTSTKLGNSGHTALRVTLSPETFSEFLSEAVSNPPSESKFKIAVSDLGLTIDPDQATFAASRHFKDGGGVLVVAEENQQVIEAVAWW